MGALAAVFALGAGVDAVSQSFVECAADIEAVRTAAAKMRSHPFIIAKIERADALGHLREQRALKEADVAEQLLALLLEAPRAAGAEP